MRGTFITFEGGEGSGKSTQAELLRDALLVGQPNREIVLTREPGGSPVAENIRKLLLDPNLGHVGPNVETLLFFAARDDHLEAVIRPALRRGAWVLCDRFTDSTRAYQGAAGNADTRLIEDLERSVVASDKPDLTLILDLPAETGLARARERDPGAKDQFEKRELEFHERLRSAYRAISETEPERCKILDATQAIDDIHEQIRSIVANHVSTNAGTPT